jgi:hypothetical protein
LQTGGQAIRGAIGASCLSYHRAPDRPGFVPWKFPADESMILPPLDDRQPISDYTTFEKEFAARRAERTVMNTS